MKQLDLFDQEEEEEEEEEELTFIQAVKEDPIQPIILSIALAIFISGMVLT